MKVVYIKGVLERLREIQRLQFMPGAKIVDYVELTQQEASDLNREIGGLVGLRDLKVCGLSIRTES